MQRAALCTCENHVFCDLWLDFICDVIKKNPNPQKIRKQATEIERKEKEVEIKGAGRMVVEGKGTNRLESYYTPQHQGL